MKTRRWRLAEKFEAVYGSDDLDLTPRYNMSAHTGRCGNRESKTERRRRGIHPKTNFGS
ncbi:MAG TPA: hypothetical protein VM912_10770 [Terriglobales bacterium]|nr:hypothetical protein [Terriglobales bacterium]